MTQFLNEVGDHFADLAAAIKGELRGLHKGGINTEPRSGQEEAHMWRKMKLLPDKEFNMVGDIIATKVGHQHHEEEPCSWCSFLMKHAGK